MVGGTLVELVGQNLAALIPLREVRTYQQGVRFSRGRDLALLEAGLYFHIPYFWEVEIIDVAAQVLNLPTQSVRTSDGVQVSFSSNIEYEVVDARAMYTNVQNLDRSLAALAMGHLARKIRRHPLDKLTAEARALEENLKRTLTTRCKKWGVRINDVALTDLVAAKAFRLYGDTPFAI